MIIVRNERLIKLNTQIGRYAVIVAILILGLENLTALHERHGQDIYDALLIAVGKRLRGCMRERDLVARLGDNEFAFLLEGSPNAQALEAVGQKIAQQLSAPVEVDGQAIQVHGNISAGSYPIDGDTPNELIQSTLTAPRAGQDKP